MTEYLLEKIVRHHGMSPAEIDPSALERLRQHDWPCNVRDLSNVRERAVLMADAVVLQATDIEQVLPTVRSVSTKISPAIPTRSPHGRTADGCGRPLKTAKFHGCSTR